MGRSPLAAAGGPRPGPRRPRRGSVYRELHASIKHAAHRATLFFFCCCLPPPSFSHLLCFPWRCASYARAQIRTQAVRQTLPRLIRLCHDDVHCRNGSLRLARRGTPRWRHHSKSISPPLQRPYARTHRAPAPPLQAFPTSLARSIIFCGVAHGASRARKERTNPDNADCYFQFEIRFTASLQREK